MRLSTVLLLAAFGAVASQSSPSVPEGAVSLREDVFVEALRPGVWRHVSFRWFPATGPIPSNGLIVRADGDTAVLVDTAWNPEQTQAILDWAERNVGPIRAVVVTHAHDDRLGGLPAVHARGIPSVALVETAEKAAAAEEVRIQRPVPSGFRLDSFGANGEIFFPGAGHTSDNAVVFFDEPAVLAGTCMVRGPEAETLGNIKEADLGSWREAIRALQARYPQVDLIVPGHGTPGGPELLTHTLDLLSE